ncbi:MAG TPA: hypothetical protein VK432_03050 [Stellaceae bacterium]|nr:hypothetical protein [Stellaceae bacterium]
MRISRSVISAAFAAGLAALPLSIAKAQYNAPCAFPLAWPFCAAGVVVGTAANIATSPFWLLSGAPPPFSYRPPPAAYYPAYYPPPPYYAPR